MVDLKIWYFELIKTYLLELEQLKCICHYGKIKERERDRNAYAGNLIDTLGKYYYRYRVICNSFSIMIFISIYIFFGVTFEFLSNLGFHLRGSEDRKIQARGPPKMVKLKNFPFKCIAYQNSTYKIHFYDTEFKILIVLFNILLGDTRLEKSERHPTL